MCFTVLAVCCCLHSHSGIRWLHPCSRSMHYLLSVCLLHPGHTAVIASVNPTLCTYTVYTIVCIHIYCIHSIYHVYTYILYTWYSPATHQDDQQCRCALFHLHSMSDHKCELTARPLTKCTRSCETGHPHLEVVSAGSAHEDAISHIEGVHHKEVDDGLQQVLQCVAEAEREGQH